MNVYSMAAVMNQAKLNAGAELLCQILSIDELDLPDFEMVKRGREKIPRINGIPVKEETEAESCEMQKPMETLLDDHEFSGDGDGENLPLSQVETVPTSQTKLGDAPEKEFEVPDTQRMLETPLTETPEISMEEQHFKKLKTMDQQQGQPQVADGDHQPEQAQVTEGGDKQQMSEDDKEPQKSEATAEDNQEPQKSEATAEENNEPEKSEATAEENNEPEKQEAMAEDEKQPQQPQQMAEDEKQLQQPQQMAEDEKQPQQTQQMAEDEKQPQQPQQMAEDEKQPQQTQQMAEDEKQPQQPQQMAEDEKQPQQPQQQMAKDDKQQQLMADDDKQQKKSEIMDDGEGDKKPKTTDEGNQKAPRGRPRKRTAEDETKDENGKKEKKENYFTSSDPHHAIQFIPSDNLSGISIWHSIWHVF